MKEKLFVLEEKTKQLLRKIQQNQNCNKDEVIKQEVFDLIELYHQMESTQFEKIDEQQHFYIYYALLLRYAGSMYLNTGDTDLISITLFSNKEKEDINSCIEYFEKCMYYCRKVETLCIINGNTENNFFEKNLKIIKDIYASVGYPLGLIYIYCKIDAEKGNLYIQESAEKGNIFSAEMMVILHSFPTNFNFELLNHYLNILQENIDINSFDKASRYHNVIEKVAKAYVFQGLYSETLSLIEFYEEMLSLSFLDEKQQEQLNTFDQIKQDCQKKLEEENSFVVGTQTLEDIFDIKTVSLMSEDVKVFLSTALEIENFMSQKAEENIALDFSPVVVSSTKALETILFKILAVDFLEFLRKQEKCKLNNVNELYKTKDRQGNIVLKFYVKELNFTIGTAIEIIADKEIYFDGLEYKPNEYFHNFCKSLEIADSEKFILDLHESLTKIQISRNNSAHKTRFLQSDASETFNLVLSMINSIYKNFQPLFLNESTND